MTATANNLSCSRCSKPAPASAKFCRRCGMDKVNRIIVAM